MVVRGKQSARLRLRMKELDCRPGEGKPVKSRRSAPISSSRIRDRLSPYSESSADLRHLHHEASSVLAQRCRCPDARIKSGRRGQSANSSAGTKLPIWQEERASPLAQISALAPMFGPVMSSKLGHRRRHSDNVLAMNLLRASPPSIADYRMARGHRLDHWGLVYDGRLPPSRGRWAKLASRIRLRAPAADAA